MEEYIGSQKLSHGLVRMFASHLPEARSRAIVVTFAPCAILSFPDAEARAKRAAIKQKPASSRYAAMFTDHGEGVTAE